jgi:hypothetical protein
VWFAFTPAADLRVEFNTFGSDFDTTLSAYFGMPSMDTEVACNDDVAEGLTSRVRFDAEAGQTYLIMAGSFGEVAGGSLMLQSDIAPLPFKATSDAVDRLQAAGVVRQVTLGRRNRAFEAVGLFEAFTGFERVLASPDANAAISPPLRPVPRRPLPG